MLCTNCHGTIWPVVAIDIDGTLADYHGHFQQFAELWLGRTMRSPSIYDGSKSHREWFCETYDVDKTTFRSIKLAYRQGGQKRMMPPLTVVPDEFIRCLRETGAEVWLTTTRPWERFDRVDPDTREWLRRHNVVFDGLIYDDNKMQALANIVDPERVCFVMDDIRSVLYDAGNLFPNAERILFQTHYNSAVEFPKVVTTLWDAFNVARLTIDKWRELYRGR